MYLGAPLQARGTGAESREQGDTAGRGCHQRLTDSEKPCVERDYEVNRKESCERPGEQRQVTAVC